MKQIVSIILFVLLIMTPWKVTYAGAFEKGLSYYKKGDYEKAFYYFEKAAKEGNPVAQNDLGVMYEMGRGVKRDFKKAVYWYQQAAKQGLAAAQFNLGRMYHNGKGIHKDYKKAAFWYEKAAKQGNARAQASLGGMYEFGIGMPRNYKKAIYWYKKAARQNLVTAQFLLGEMYASGRGIPQNLKKATYWLQRAYNNPKCTDTIKKSIERIWKKYKLWKYKETEQAKDNQKRGLPYRPLHTLHPKIVVPFCRRYGSHSTLSPQPHSHKRATNCLTSAD